MKKIFLSAMLLLLATAANAQKDVTKFLGIPVDGTKAEMIEKLKEKGFTSSHYEKDVLVGEFNGEDVRIHIVTNNNKVYRIVVYDNLLRDETDIKIRFNTLCSQFIENKKYTSYNFYNIFPTEDIAHQMTVNKKRYEAVYYQYSRDQYIQNLEKIGSDFDKKYSQEYLSKLSEDAYSSLWLSYLQEYYAKKSVWFMIDKVGSKYRIIMYYDNEYNRANGEDL